MNFLQFLYIIFAVLLKFERSLNRYFVHNNNNNYYYYYTSRRARRYRDMAWGTSVVVAEACYSTWLPLHRCCKTDTTRRSRQHRRVPKPRRSSHSVSRRRQVSEKGPWLWRLYFWVHMLPRINSRRPVRAARRLPAWKSSGIQCVFQGTSDDVWASVSLYSCPRTNEFGRTSWRPCVNFMKPNVAVSGAPRSRQTVATHRSCGVHYTEYWVKQQPRRLVARLLTSSPRISRQSRLTSSFHCDDAIVWCSTQGDANTFPVDCRDTRRSKEDDWIGTKQDMPVGSSSNLATEGRSSAVVALHRAAFQQVAHFFL